MVRITAVVVLLILGLAQPILAQRTLRVLVPNGTESWNVGDIDTIRWTWTGGVTRVKLDYSTNLGTTWIAIEAATVNDSLYAWNIPNVPSTQSLIKVTDVDSTSVSDVSDNAFSMVASLRLINPVGAETLTAGGRSNIRWSGSKGIAKVRLEYSTNAGSTWNTITTSTQHDTVFPWNVPNTPSNQCRVRISDYDVSATNDMSPANFVIAAKVTVVFPNGGENLTVGSIQNITWTAPSGITLVKIEYTTNGGSSWVSVAASAPNNGVYAWEVPNTPAGVCRVKVSDYGNSAVTDMSDADFRIASTVVVSSPNGGEQLRIGRIHFITWTAPAGVSKVGVDYSTNGGTSWTAITSLGGWVNRGLYAWNIPNTPSTQCRVRVSDVDNTPVFDVSDSNFTITATDIEETGSPTMPRIYHQGQNRPNPFSRRATIAFSIPQDEPVQLKVYNAAGEVVRVLVNERRPAGFYRTEWNGQDDRGRDLPNGVYFYQLQTGNFVDTKKAVILR